MSLFLLGGFELHSGQKSAWKVDCDYLTIHDWCALAKMASEALPPFGTVEAVTHGGKFYKSMPNAVRFADCLRMYTTKGCPTILIADDVLTTGKSMEEERRGRDNVIGVVAFSRGVPPSWVTPLFQMPVK